MVGIDYEIKVTGAVPAQMLDLPDARLTRHGVDTVLRVPLVDQSALIGIINGLHLLGVDLQEVRRAGGPGQRPEGFATRA